MVYTFFIMEPQEKPSYKPSKQFIIRGSIAAGTIVLILLFQTNWFFGFFTKREKVGAKPGETVGSLVSKDTNGNGIADWEEKLWGLDPAVLYTNGVSNKQIIEERKKALGINETKNAPLNETDLLAQQLFTITSALDTSGQSKDTLSAIGADLGNSVEIKPVTNTYTINSIKTIQTTTDSLRNYYGAVTKVVSGYKSETSSIDILVSSLETGDFSRIDDIKKTAALYLDFSKKLQKIPVPIGIAEYHLSLMNGFAGMAKSFDYLLDIEDNGVNALAGISIYKNYAARVEDALTKLNDYFIEYGILR